MDEIALLQDGLGAGDGALAEAGDHRDARVAGYVELADCKFDASQTWYDALAAKLRREIT